MFLVSDSLNERHARIRSFMDKDIFIGVLLATMDFEWTIRRCILALGRSPNKDIREKVLVGCHGLNKYKVAWKDQVYPRFGVRLPELITDWQEFKEDAFELRHQLIHGIRGGTTIDYATIQRNRLLAGSASLVKFSSENNVDIYSKLPVRRKELKLKVGEASK